jgi:hypothetical protein
MWGMREGAWLDGLHHALDPAIAVAYGWADDRADEEILARPLFRHSLSGEAEARSIKSFLLLFFKKEVLPYL